MFSSDDDMDGHLHEVGPIELHNNGNTTPGCDTFLTYRVGLSDQFRIDAGQEIIDWIDRLTDTTAVGIDKIPADSMNRKRPHGIHGADAYDLRIYRSPIDLAAAIRQRRIEMRKHAEEARGKKHSPSSAQVAAPLCRMLATFDWAYDPVNKSGDVVLYKMKDAAEDRYYWSMPVDGHAPDGYEAEAETEFLMPWNYADPSRSAKREQEEAGAGKKRRRKTDEDESSWVADDEADGEVGSFFTVQGFDLNYAGVIIGPSIRMREGRIVVDKAKAQDRIRKEDIAENGSGPPA